jgi:hypothetical protein
MMRVTTRYVTRIPQCTSETRRRADELVRWGAAALQGQVRLSILNWPTGPIVDTGNMLNSVDFAMEDVARAVVFVGAEYAPFVEFGTSKREGRPFFQHAVSEFQPAFRGMVRQLGDDLESQYGGRA